MPETAKRFLPLTAPIAVLNRWLRRRREFRRVLRELKAMSSRELAQKGLSREVITRLALEASRKV